MNIFTPKLVSSPNRDQLFDADKREANLKIFYAAVDTDVQFNKETGKAEVCE